MVERLREDVFAIPLVVGCPSFVSAPTPPSPTPAPEPCRRSPAAPFVKLTATVGTWFSAFLLLLPLLFLQDSFRHPSTLPLMAWADACGSASALPGGRRTDKDRRVLARKHEGRRREEGEKNVRRFLMTSLAGVPTSPTISSSTAFPCAKASRISLVDRSRLQRKRPASSIHL